jgi:FkbM family methyltransferase
VEIPPNEQWAVHVAEQIAQPNWVCVDIGAGDGIPYIPLLMQWLNSHGRIIAFEPGPKNYQALGANIKRWSSGPDRPAISTYQVALSDMPDTQEVFHYQYWTLLPVADPRLNHSMGQGRERFTAKFMLLDDYELPRVDLIKLDVDGYELKILRGGRETIEAHKPVIIVELGHFTLEYFGHTVGALAQFLIDRGYVFRFPGDVIRGNAKEISECTPGGEDTVTVVAECRQ